MPQWTIWAVLGGVFLLYLLVQIISKSKKPIKSTILTLSIGLISLFVVNITSSFTGVYIPLSTLTICSSAIGGIPAVTLLLVLNMFI